MRTTKLRSIAVVASLTILAALPLSAQATHAWGSYHWARSSNPVALTVVDSMTAAWDGKLSKAISDWDQSTVLALTKENGATDSKSRKRCAAITGKVRACNATYGFNLWLGMAQIYLSGSHITKATAKMNDSYLASSVYNDIADQHVICQEIGHDWGLGHQDETGADLGTCMDYADALDNPSPDAHDYAQLVSIYGDHVDAAAPAPTKPGGGNLAGSVPGADAAWGRLAWTSSDGRVSTFVRDLGRGFRVITHVTWVR